MFFKHFLPYLLIVVFTILAAINAYLTSRVLSERPIKSRILRRYYQFVWIYNLNSFRGTLLWLLAPIAVLFLVELPQALPAAAAYGLAVYHLDRLIKAIRGPESVEDDIGSPTPTYSPDDKNIHEEQIR